MATVIDMPKLSDTMQEGGIAEWLKKEGEKIEEGEPLLSIETDKATMEYASPHEGTLLKILVPAGKTVGLKKPIAVIGAKGEAFNLDQLVGASAEKSPAKAGVEAAAPKAAASTHAEKSPGANAHTGGRVKASPLAKKIAHDKGIDLNAVQGSGPLGRIVQKDLTGISARQSPTPSAARVGRASRQIPHSMMRKTIAKRLLAAKNEAPHFYLTVSANMEAMVQWRKQLNAANGQNAGDAVKVSLNDLIVLAVAKALRLHPQVNASWHDDYVEQHANIDISIAVALETGLVTPVLLGADQLTVREIAQQGKALVAKAKDGKLTPEDYQGGTFTISNLGMTKVEEFTAIINPPQACILAVGTTQLVPHITESGQIIAQNRMKMTMSCDHRVVDGMVGARFLETLVSFLENPLLMLA